MVEILRISLYFNLLRISINHNKPSAEIAAGVDLLKKFSVIQSFQHPSVSKKSIIFLIILNDIEFSQRLLYAE